MPYTIRATLAGLAGIDRSLTEAALILGATERRAFWDVTFPLARTGIVSGAIFAFAVSMDDVAVSIMLTDANTYHPAGGADQQHAGQFRSHHRRGLACMLMLVTLALILILEQIRRPQPGHRPGRFSVIGELMPPSPETVIEFRNVSKRFGATTAVDNVTLHRRRRRDDLAARAQRLRQDDDAAPHRRLRGARRRRHRDRRRIHGREAAL